MVGGATGKERKSNQAKSFIATIVLTTGFGLFFSAAAQAGTCEREMTAEVVAFDMPLMYNRLGAADINGMMYALRRDVVRIADNVPLSQIQNITSLGGGLTPLVTLRPDKRPRPLVLRMAEGDCMTITLTNLLTNSANPNNPVEERSGIPFRLAVNNQVASRAISLRFQGTESVNDIDIDENSWVGENASSLVEPGAQNTYKIRAPKAGSFVGNSLGGTLGGEGLGGQTASGLWGVLGVDAMGSVFYRNNLTHEEMALATTGTTAQGHPILDYEAVYPNEEPWTSEGKAGLPIVNMITPTGETVHSNLDAVVAYGADTFQLAYPEEAGGYYGSLGHFPPSAYPLESVGLRNPTVPNRLEPFREFTIAFHDEVTARQAFPAWFEDPIFQHTLHGVRDSFMINYGSGGIGSEIIANRLGVGPMHDCVNCAYEEFFLTFHTVGEVGQLTDIPANFGLENCNPALQNCEAIGPKANFVLYPEDPSNVHHGYTGDATAFKNVHAGPAEQHVFHLHNHQWLFNADDDNSNYIDAQGLGPGSGYPFRINFGGAGNRNKTAGDAIFHCHFYPHFAQGMWEMWRIHDTFEPGTALQTTVDGGGVHTSFVVDGIGLGDGTPAVGARALPDGEIVVGAPTPAIVPLPGKPMAPMPAAGVTVKPNPNTVVQIDPTNPAVIIDPARPVGSLSVVPDRTKNPGYPFWIAGMEHTIGNRPPSPPMDMITNEQAAALHNSGDDLWQHPGFDDADAIDGWDGGLPRFAIQGYSAGGQTMMAATRLDFTKEFVKAKPVFFPEEGTDLEQVAMAFHATRCHDTFLPDGSPAECSGGDVTGDGLDDNGGFITNGALPVPGAPFMEPCIDDQGRLMDDGVVGNFFSGELKKLTDPSAMNTHGRSPHSAANPRYYKAANVQFDAVFNKQGYHFPQERIITLWQDVVPTIRQERPPEPFVMRMNTFDCTQYVHSNVVPKVYELDDYQVRTPTDIIGQHIHLPKWDLTTTDGAANGWNYEDGTLAPQAVVEMIEAINHWNADPANTPVLTNVNGDPVVDSSGHSLTSTGLLEPADHPFFGSTEFAEHWVGARSTMQRWFADPVVNVQGIDRGLGIVFTHDHFGPSTHQQVGLYATLLVEPAGSKWVHNEEGVQLGLSPDGTSPAGRLDGGPTSWQAAILTGDAGFSDAYTENVGGADVESHREFYFEYSDFQHAYQPGVYVGADNRGFALVPYEAVDANGDGLIDNPITAANPDTFRDAIQPSFRQQASLVNGFPVDIWEFPATCPGTDPLLGVVVPRPCPEAITADDPGIYVVNYRGESLGARVYDPNRLDCPDGRPGCQAKGKAGDLAFAMDSTVTRAIPELNSKLGLAPPGYAGGSCTGGVFCPPINSLDLIQDGDPFTPIPRTFDGDRVSIKMQGGGQEEEHTAMVHGVKWLQAGSGFGEAKNSGWRNVQAGGISEQFSLRTPIYADIGERSNRADYAYTMNASVDGWMNGSWGIMRSYTVNNNSSSNLFPIGANDANIALTVVNAKDFDGVCPANAPVQQYDITAVQANDMLPVNGDVTIQDLFPGTHAGAAPESNGRTLVYNPRTTSVAGTIDPETGLAGARGGTGPLHDPTAMLYVKTSDLESLLGPGGSIEEEPYCWDPGKPATEGELVCNRRGKNCKIRGGDPAEPPKYNPTRPGCKLKLKAGVAIEPVVIRAAAGDCIDITLRNKILAQAYDDNGDLVFWSNGEEAYSAVLDDADELEVAPVLMADTDQDGVGDSPPSGTVYFDQTLDLASGNAITGFVRRDRGVAPNGMTTFQSNLMQPSAYIGLHPQLVEYDVTRADGTMVGQNGNSVVAPGGKKSYQWYAGHIDATVVVEETTITTGKGSKKKTETVKRRNVELVATPVEFGGFNLMPADKMEQGQKGLMGAGVIYPEGAVWSVDAGTTTSATVYSPPLNEGDPERNFRDFTTIAQKSASMFYADTYPVENLLGEGSFGVAEDAQDMGAMTINYGNEAMWFRFGINPTDHPAMSNEPNADMSFSNALVGGDPETPVFAVQAGDPFRMHVLMPFAAGRGSTFDLHGHVWQRDPYVCPGNGDTGSPGAPLKGKCDMGNGHAGNVAGNGQVGSQALGWNPQGFYLGGIESWFGSQHYEIVIPRAGGSFQVDGDYLFQDRMGLGHTAGLWGIVRVQARDPF
jgi:hypothetical protein